MALRAAAVTYFAGIAVVPIALLAVWITGLVLGADRVRRLTGHTIAALPDEIGAPHALAALINAGLHMTPALALASLLPATFYGEGLRRAFVSLRDGGSRSSAGGAGSAGCRHWRPHRRCCWRCFSPSRRPAAYGYEAAALVIGSFTAANLAGFLHGFVLFCSLPLNLGAPFGGFATIGGTVAVGLWLYVFHVIMLAGYAATQSASTYLRNRRSPEPVLVDETPEVQDSNTR